jgi:hypothetical protein
MLNASININVAFFMFWFDQAARYVARDVAAGLLVMEI